MSNYPTATGPGGPALIRSPTVTGGITWPVPPRLATAPAARLGSGWLLAALLLPQLAAAQTLKGFLLEEGTRSPVSGATIELSAESGGGTQRASTDSLGAFQLHARRTGVFLLRAAHPSYAPVADTVTIGPEESVLVELLVSRVVIPLQPLVVKARSQDPFGGFHARAERSGFGRFLTREQIDRRPGGRATDLLRSLAGVQIVRSQIAPGFFTNLITLRGLGPGGCLPMVYIDGMPLRQLPDHSVDDFLHPEMLEGVEIYTGMASVPAQFQSLDACGVVAFWTRNDSRRPFSWRRVAVALGVLGLIVLLAR